MDSQNFIPQFDAFTLHRLLRRNSVARVVHYSKMVFVVLIILLVVILGSIVIEEFLSVQSTLTKLENQVGAIDVSSGKDASPVPDAKSYRIIHEKSIFGELAPARAAATPPPAKKKSETSLALIGTFISGGTVEAIIEDTKKNSQEVFSIGDSIFDTATLEAVFSDRVEIKREGKIEILTIDDALTGGGGESDSSAGDAEEFAVDEQELTEALDNLPLLLTQARAVPYFKDGKAVGLRLFAIKNGSLYEKIGLKNGDILKSINGNSLGDITQAMKLFEKIKEERDVMLELERNRTKKSFRYRIQ